MLYHLGSGALMAHTLPLVGRQSAFRKPPVSFSGDPHQVSASSLSAPWEGMYREDLMSLVKTYFDFPYFSFHHPDALQTLLAAINLKAKPYSTPQTIKLSDLARKARISPSTLRVILGLVKERENQHDLQNFITLTKDSSNPATPNQYCLSEHFFKTLQNLQAQAPETEQRYHAIKAAMAQDPRFEPWEKAVFQNIIIDHFKVNFMTPYIVSLDGIQQQDRQLGNKRQHLIKLLQKLEDTGYLLNQGKDKNASTYLLGQPVSSTGQR